MIVVTGPTGNIGGKLLARLAQGGEPLRVVARDPAKIPAPIRDKVEIVVGSYTDPAVVTKAFAGARAVFWLMLGNPAAASADAAFVDAARAAASAVRDCGVARIVTVSALGRGWPKSAGHATASIRMDDLFAQTGAAVRALACPSLMENVLRQVQGIREKSVFFGVAPRAQREPLVAAADIADAAFRLLVDPAWTGVADMPLLGAEDISGDEMAATMGGVLGKKIDYREMAAEDLRGGMLARGASPGMAQAMVEMMTAKNEGLDRMIARDAANTTPTRFRDWCETTLKPVVNG